MLEVDGRGGGGAGGLTEEDVRLSDEKQKPDTFHPRYIDLIRSHCPMYGTRGPKTN